MLITLDVSELARKLSKITDGLQNAVSRGLADAGETGTTRAKTLTYYKVHSPSGLQGQTQYRDRGPLYKQIIADKFYATWVNNGNGPPGSRIYPKRAKALRFMINGQVIFRKWVRASTPRPFMTNTFEFEKQYLPRAIERSLDEFFRRA